MKHWDDDDLIEKIETETDFWNCRDRLMAVTPSTFDGLVEQVRIAYTTGLDGSDGWQDKVLEDLLRIGRADLSTRDLERKQMEDRRREGDNDPANLIFAEYLQYAERSRAWRKKIKEAEGRGEDTKPLFDAEEAEYPEDWSIEIYDRLLACGDTPNAAAAFAFRSCVFGAADDKVNNPDNAHINFLLRALLPQLTGCIRKTAEWFVSNPDATLGESPFWC